MAPEFLLGFVNGDTLKKNICNRRPKGHEQQTIGIKIIQEFWSEGRTEKEKKDDEEK